MSDQDTINATPVTAPVVLTKEEKIAKVDKEIARLQKKREDIINDVVRATGPKAIVLPAVGADVLFNYGRNTATSSVEQLLGRVVAIKPASVTEAGKKTPAQIKVSVGEGFDQEFYVIYPAQIADAGPAAE